MDRSNEVTITWISVALIFTMIVVAIEGPRRRTTNRAEIEINNECIECTNL